MGRTVCGVKGKIIYPVAGLLLAASLVMGLAACAGGQNGAGNPLVEVTRGDLTVTVSGSGNLSVSRDADLFFEDGGKLERIFVAEGDRVQQGDVLARLVPLNTDLLERAVETAISNLASAEIGVSVAQNNYSLRLAQDPYDISALERAVANAEIGLSALDSDLATADINLETATNNYKKLFIGDPFRTYEFALDEYADVLGQARRTLEQIEADIASGLVSSATLQDEVAEARQQVADIEQKLLYGLGEGSRPFEINYWTLRAAQLQIDAATAARDKVLAARQQAQLSLDKANDDLQKAGELQEATLQGLLLDISRAELSRAQAQSALDKARADLAGSELVAPWDGQVAEVAAREGDIIPAAGAATKKIIYLVDPLSLELQANLDEVDIAHIAPGQPVNLKVDALPQNSYTGTVASIGLIATNAAGLVSYPVKISLDTTDSPELRAGMSATVDIVTDERQDAVLLLSRLIVRDSQGDRSVTVSVNGRLETRSVTVGVTDGYLTEILAGLTPGEMVFDKRAAAAATNSLLN